jgi:hypothetical protein
MKLKRLYNYYILIKTFITIKSTANVTSIREKEGKETNLLYNEINM